MTKRLISSLVLAGFCALLAGCPAAEDSPGRKRPAPGAVSPAVTSPVATRVEEGAAPALRYVPLDAPEGMSQAVVVAGLPLVHTRQLLPLDSQGQLVGKRSAEKQVEQVMANLRLVLEDCGTGLARLVRVNVYADSPQTADLVRQYLAEHVKPAVRPAITAVVTPLCQPEAVVAVDAVAAGEVASPQGASVDTVALKRCAAVAGDARHADAAVMPPGGVVYLSGQPDKSPPEQAAGKSLAALLEILTQLKIDRAEIVQLKVFLESAAAAETVLQQIREIFANGVTPPVVFVEWIASAPVEIEMIARLPAAAGAADEPVRYYTPPGVKPSATFSRVALVESGAQIYISGLSARVAGNGEAQVRDVFKQLQEILSATGGDLRHLAKATYYVCDEDASSMLNRLRPEYYDPQRPPAASKATVHGVGRTDRSLTLDMIAVGAGR